MNITVSSLTKSFDGHMIFSIPEFSFEKGITCISGSSGCGKTTFGRIVCGLEKADSGNVNGVVGIPTVLFQESRLLPSLSAYENVKIVCRSKESALTAKGLLEKLSFTKKDMKKLPSELSGGMMRRVAIVRAIVFALEKGGNLVLLDEPFSALDKEIKGKAAALISELLGDKIVFVITHDEADAELLKGRHVFFSSFAD